MIAFGTASASAKETVDIAAGNDDFSTLVAAVQAVGLLDILKGEGPFTVLAPTNDAFAKLPAGSNRGERTREPGGTLPPCRAHPAWQVQRIEFSRSCFRHFSIANSG